MKNKLNELCENGTLKSWTLDDLDEEGNVVSEGHPPSNFLNSQRLILEFPNGEELVLTTWCSGTA